MALYRKKPIVIDAWKFQADIQDVGQQFLLWEILQDDLGIHVLITTLEGTMRAEPGDWVIKGVKGEYYPCKPDIFDATYEPVE